MSPAQQHQQPQHDDVQMSLVGSMDSSSEAGHAQERASNQTPGLTPALACRLVGRLCQSVFPPLTWIPAYNVRENLLRDAAGGLVIGVMFVPTVIGYASLVSIPLHIGLWSAVLYSGIYAFFGNTGVLSMGPVPEVTLLLLSTPGLTADAFQRARTLQTVAFEVGFLSLGLCFIMGGSIIRNSFARAVGDAYAAAAAIIIIVVEVKDAVNIHGTTKVLLQDAIQVVITGLEENTNWTGTGYCLLMFFVQLAYLMGVKQLPMIPTWVPHQLIIVVAAILITWGARLDTSIGLLVVKSVQSDWPPAAAPDTTIIGDTIVTGVVVTIVSFLQAYSIGTRFSDNVNANQELFANGLCAFVSGFVGTMPGSSSFARSSVLSDIKVKTPLNSFIASIIVLIAIVGLTRADVFYYLPKATVAAIITAAVSKLINFSHAIWLFQHFKVDFLVWIFVFLLTLFTGVTYGILGGIGLSTLIVLFRVGIPNSYTLGYDPVTDRWIDRTVDDELLLHREVHVWSFDSPIYFINVNYFVPELEESLRLEKRPIRVVVVNCASVTSIDANSVEGFVFQVKNLEARRGITIVFSAMKNSVKQGLKQCPVTGFDFQCFTTIRDAVTFADRLVMNEKQLLAPYRPVPAIVFRSDVKSSTTDRTVAIAAVVSSADRSPKQEIKLPVTHPELQQIIDACGGHIATGSAEYAAVHRALRQWPQGEPAVRRRAALALAHLLDEHDGVSLTVTRSDADGTVLVANWGGTVTLVGLQQAVSCGEALATRLGFHYQQYEEKAIDETRSLPAQLGELWSRYHHPVVVRAMPTLTAVSNGEDCADRTAHTLVSAFARAASGRPDASSDVPLTTDPVLHEVTDALTAFNERCSDLVESALHSKTTKEANLVLHFPGMRRVVASIAHHVDKSHRAPFLALQNIVELLVELIRSVRDGGVMERRTSFTAADPDLGPMETSSSVPFPSIPNDDGDDEGAPPASAPLTNGDVDAVAEVVDEAAAEAPKAAAAVPVRRSLSGLKRRAVAAAAAPVPAAAFHFAEGESQTHLVWRYYMVLAQLLRRDDIMTGKAPPHTAPSDDSWTVCDADLEQLLDDFTAVRFDTSKITALYDNATYDVIHNAKALETLCGYDLRPLVALLQPVYVAVSSGRFGVTSSGRLIGGALQSMPLLRRLRQHFTDQVDAVKAAPSPTTGSSTASVTERHVPVNMIFTSESVITALRNCMAFSETMLEAANPAAQAALLRDETGWHYMAHVVFSLTTNDASDEADASTQSSMHFYDDYMLEVFVSTGASLASDAAKELMSDDPLGGYSSPPPEMETSSTKAVTVAPLHEPFGGAADASAEQHETISNDSFLWPPMPSRQALTKTEQAARHLSRVAPMQRVWRVSLQGFIDVVAEMEHVVETWLDSEDVAA